MLITKNQHVKIFPTSVMATFPYAQVRGGAGPSAAGSAARTGTILPPKPPGECGPCVRKSKGPKHFRSIVTAETKSQRNELISGF